jgi:hypothetical protein
MAKKVAVVGKSFYEARARSLATVYLTGRDDLVVREANEDDVVDLQVLIKNPHKAGARTFGVELQYVKSDVPSDRANALLKPRLEVLSSYAFSFPACLFFFRMKNDKGFYTWVAEPVVTAEGTPVLCPHNTASVAELDTAALDDIVAAVNAWYDAFYANVVQGTNGRRKRNGLQVLHAIIDGEAAYFSEHGASPTILKLPVLQAYELAKLGREHLGDLAGQLIKHGIRLLEKDGLLGMKVKLVTDQQEFSFE